MSNQTDILTTKSLIQSLYTMIEAQLDLEAYPHFQHYMDNQNKAVNDFAERLETYIDQAIQRRLDQSMNPQ